MCAIDGAEPFRVSRTEERKARKENRCTECQRTIHAGERYTFIAGLVDAHSGWETFRICRHCKPAGAWLQIACGGYPVTMLIEELDEHAREYPESRVLPELLTSIRGGWGDGQAPVPSVPALEADAWHCIRQLVSP